MNANHDLDRRIADLYAAEAPARAPDWVLGSALATVETTQQRRAPIRLPWRFPIMGLGPSDRLSPRAWSRPVVLVLVAVLLALLAASAVLIGARLQDATPWPIEPVSGTFAQTGSLATARSTHTAVLLADGRVLILGGDTLEDRWSLPAEVYDPRTGAFIQLGSRPGLDRGPVDDDGFSATLLGDGRVLIAGGWDGNTFVDPPWSYEREAVLLDPSSGTTEPTGQMQTGRTGHVAARLADGRVLVVGGTGTMLRDGSIDSLASAEIYDPQTGTFSPTGAMACPRTSARLSDFTAAVLPSGRILVTGGDDLQACPNDEVYDPATGRFASVLTEGSREADPTIVIEISGKVHRYDLLSGTAIDVTPLGADVELAFGPRCRDFEWDCRGDMTTTMMRDGRVLLTGGDEIVLAPGSEKGWRSVAKTVGELLDPATGTVVATGPLVQPRHHHTATLLPDGRVLVIGGEAYPRVPEHRVLLPSAEIFTPG